MSKSRRNPTVREATAQVVGVLKRADLTFHKPATRRTPMIEGVEVSGNIRRGAVCVVAWSKSNERARAAYQTAKDAVLAEGWPMMFDNPMGATFCVAPPLASTARENPPAPRWKAASRVQSLLFERPYFTERKAKAWAKKHGFRFGSVDVTVAYIRLRQEDPEHFRPSTFRTIVMTDGVKSVIAVPKRAHR